MNPLLKQRKEIFTILNQMLNWDYKRCVIWFRTPHPSFKGYTPCEMVMEHRGHELIQWIKGCRGY